MKFEDLHIGEKKMVLDWLNNKNILVFGFSRRQLERIEKTITKEERKFWEGFFKESI